MGKLISSQIVTAHREITARETSMPPRNRPPDYLPPEVCNHPEVINACRARDIGRLFRLINNLTDGPHRFTASHLARRCELTQSRVADYMTNRTRATSIKVVTRIADGLHIPGPMLGIMPRPWELQPQPPSAPTPTRVTLSSDEVSPEDDPDAGELDEMNRRELLRALSVAGALVALPPSASTALELAQRTDSGYVGRKLQQLQTQLAPLAPNDRIAELADNITTLTRSV
jgi:transcriptional regulator with XRE-family HTH domain